MRGLDLVWESATPPTHIWERSPKKNGVFLAASLSMRRGEGERKIIIAMLIIVVMMRTMIIAMQKVFGG